MTFINMTIDNMTFRPAARCGLDAGGNLRRLVGSAWSGGIFISIAGRFGRCFRDWVAGEWFPGEWFPGSLTGSLPGGAERRRDVSGSGSADCAPPDGDDRSGMVRPPCPSGARGKMPSPRDCHHNAVAGPCVHSSSSGALFAGDSALGFFNLALLLPAQACRRVGSVLLMYHGRFSEEVFLVPLHWDTAQNPRRGPGRPTDRSGQGVMRGSSPLITQGRIRSIFWCVCTTKICCGFQNRKTQDRFVRSLGQGRFGQMKNKRITASCVSMPLLVTACLISNTQAQIDPVNGYQCNAGEFVITNNLSLVIDETNPTCTLPVEMAQ